MEQGHRTVALGFGLAIGVGLGGCLIGENPYWDPHSAVSATSGATTQGTSPGTVSGGVTASVGTETAPTTTAASQTTDATTGPDGSMGQPCASVPMCDEGQSCCRSLQCLDTCLIFCALDPGVCPAGMVCEHGYCLLGCNGDDADCASWPGFTCQHDGTACENYDPPDSTGTGASTGM